MDFFEIAPGTTSRKGRVAPFVGSAGPGERDVFAAYLDTLEPGAEAASDETLAAFYAALRRLVRRQLIRRGLWAGPPRFVGVAGGDRWTAEALDELTSDALIHLLERVRLLRRHLAAKDTVDGLVRLEIGHFLHDRQRRADPLGHRLYGVVHEAVRRAIDAGVLEVADGDERITNGTMLCAGIDFDKAGHDAEPIDGVTPVDRVARRLVDELMPDLVTGWGKRRAAVVRSLAERLDRLAAEGVDSCRFKDLLDAVKRAVRWRWAEILAREAAPEPTDDPWATVAPAIGSPTPDAPFEARQNFDALIACVTDRVERADDLGRRSHEHFRNLWHFLRLRVLETPGETGTLPSRRRIADLLGIPRSTLGGLFERLGRLVNACGGGSRPSPTDDED